jgi:hypothetical protein
MGLFVGNDRSRNLNMRMKHRFPSALYEMIRDRCRLLAIGLLVRCRVEHLAWNTGARRQADSLSIQWNTFHQHGKIVSPLNKCVCN